MERVRTDDGSWTLRSSRYGETYRSRHGAVAEARHVFLEGSGIAAALTEGRAVRVREVGLGTGLTLALTATAALRHAATLHYVAIEHDPLPADVVATLALDEVADPDFVAALVGWWQRFPEGPLAPLHHGSVRVEAILADATQVALPGGVDALFLDGFSAAVNPELWTPEMLGRFAATLVPGGTLVSYSVRGSVRRALAVAGLEVERRQGPPGGKRQSLRAVRPSRTSAAAER
jgi:tRNA U34 5-methylaminomethyl-2-thiouridine-forming methyltransferase MnmC